MSGALAGSAGVAFCGLSATSQVARIIHMVEAGRENKQRHRKTPLGPELRAGTQSLSPQSGVRVSDKASPAPGGKEVGSTLDERCCKVTLRGYGFRMGGELGPLLHSTYHTPP